MNKKSSFVNFNREQMNDDVKIYLETGTLLNGQYVIDKPVFHNDRFISYLAFDRSTNLNVIIKEFFPKSIVYRNTYRSSNITIKDGSIPIFEDLKNNFIQIFDVLQKFKENVSVIKTLSSFESNDTYYCVQEIPQGLTLKRYLFDNYGELNWSQSKNMFLRLIEFLQHLHSHNIFYCGLNPETIVVHNNILKIVDFSNAIVNRHQFIFPSKLYDGYAPIEQYNNLNLGTFTDVYSLAAVIYKSLTGTKPVNSMSRLLNDNLLPPKVLNPNIPKNISVSIMSALILSSKMRTQTMSDFFDDLTAQSRDFYKNTSGEPKIHTHINTIEPIKKKKRKRDQEELTSKEGEEDEEDEEMKTHSLIFMAMLISSSIVLFTAAIVIFILFRNNFFNL